MTHLRRHVHNRSPPLAPVGGLQHLANGCLRDEERRPDVKSELLIEVCF